MLFCELSVLEFGLRDGLFIAALTAASSLALAWSLNAPAAESGELAAIFPPNVSSLQAFEATVAAGGMPLRQGGTSFILVVAGNEPFFAQRLRDNGAWLVVKSKHLAACGVTAHSDRRDKIIIDGAI